MNIHPWRSVRVPVIGMSAAVVLLLSSCGSDTELVGSQNSTSAPAGQPDSTKQGNAEPDSATLDESLKDFPLPAGYEVPFPASKYKDSDGRVTMAQTVIVPMTHLKAAKVIFDGLPGTGYTVLDKGTGFATSVDGIHPQNGGAIAFKDAKGRSGQVVLKVQGDKTGLNFNVDLG